MRVINDESFLAVGLVVRAHGARGKIKVKVYSGDALGLLSASSVSIQDNDLAGAFPLTQRVKGYLRFDVQSIQNMKSFAILSLEGVHDMDQARSLIGRRVYISKEDLPETGEDEYYYFELEGYRIEDERGRHLGKVSRLIPSPAHDILEVETPAGAKLVPFVAQFVPEVRRHDRVIVLTPIKGMLDDEV